MSFRTSVAAGMTAAGIAVGALTAVVGVTGGAPAAGAVTAPATQVNGSPSGAPPSNATCVSVPGAKACFADYGDLVYVEDTKANGQPVAGEIQAIAPHHWLGQCYDGRGQAAGWTMCDFDVPENQGGWLWVGNNPWVGDQARTSIGTSGGPCVPYEPDCAPA